MIFLRETTDDDIELTMAWRSNPLIYKNFYVQKEPLSWEEHYAWYKSRGENWRQFIIIMLSKGDKGRRVGLVNVGELDKESPEIGYLVGEVKLWGKGVGKEAVKQVLDWVKGQGKHYCRAMILDNNERSIGLVKGLGFEYVCQSREGESCYQKKF